MKDGNKRKDGDSMTNTGSTGMNTNTGSDRDTSGADAKGDAS